MLFYGAAAACAIGVVMIAALLFRKAERATDDDSPDGATGGHTGAMLSALFLLAFAMAVVVPWTTSDAARANTYVESQAVAEAFWASTRLPAPDAARIQAGLREYVDLVRGPEWRMMADGRLSPDGWRRLEALRRQVAALPAADEEAKDDRDALADRLEEIAAARRQRAMDAKAAPPPGLLIATAGTGLAVLLFPFLAGARPRGMTIVPLALMAALLGFGVYLAFDIQHAFAGGLAVPPDAYTDLLPELDRIQGGG
ncbi:hypothetical protein Arub01_50020 [Actinomadura rubrobrunea]|uniref:DUF4239 domain-containing protein n=1 Tax=Actinomadura rubrobrunea TaxID=115335 RepID=A0A9W6Q1J9_9ACTN|nr:DUF4239 domain-containing protein [Actinomadura rubrobrunea]GLW66758.1 hypothetical protein Arub01_50020 [Actinomadura rubrobrunea]